MHVLRVTASLFFFQLTVAITPPNPPTHPPRSPTPKTRHISSKPQHYHRDTRLKKMISDNGMAHTPRAAVSA